MTVLYALGYLWVGALLALVVGVLDGLDGKLARLKVQTTKAGKREHLLDFLIEMSWWTALAYHFHSTGQVRYAYVILVVFFAFFVTHARCATPGELASRENFGTVDSGVT